MGLLQDLIPHFHHWPTLPFFQKKGREVTPGNSRREVENMKTPRGVRRSEYSPSVPSGSKAQEVRAASRPPGTGRKTSPGSWRQGSKSYK
jgi:hypothetical protein